MSVLINISTGNPVTFVAPSIDVTFSDATPSLSSVSAWEWKYNDTIVSNASSWSHTFFSDQTGEIILSVSSSTVPIEVSETTTFVIEPAWPTYPSYRILPSNNFSFTTGSGVATITAQNTSPEILTGTRFVSSLTYLSGDVLGTPSITGFDISTYYDTITANALSYNWYYNDVNVSTSRDWVYNFFNPTTGSIYTNMSSMAFMGSAYYTNSTAFSGISSIWSSLSSIPTYTQSPGLCTLPTQTITINEAERFNRCNTEERVTPVGIRGSTTLSPIVTSYELLSERIKMQLGWPITNIELCDDQIYDAINQGCEWYSKYAGYTEEYLVFDSRIYQCGYGIKIDNIINQITDFYCPYSTASRMVSGQYIDCDTNNYRKVAGIFSLDPAGSNGYSSEILFNMDYMFAQQAYFGQMMGGFGYDITTWYLLKEWMDLRRKMFATDVYVTFNPTTQLLKLTPEPHVTAGLGRYIGIIGCRMEKSVKELVQQRWVQKYALALCKISLAHIRGKFGGVTLFGGGQINATDLMTQGISEREALENEFKNGYGEGEPPMFFVG